MIIVGYSDCGKTYKEQHEAGILLRDSMLSCAGYNPKELVFDVSDKGKPFVRGADFSFSVSHSECMAMCVLNTPKNFEVPDTFTLFPGSFSGVGADIEVLDDHMTLEQQKKIASRYLNKDVSSADEFYRYWTQKEAAGKLSGKGVFSHDDPSGIIFFTFTVKHERLYIATIAAAPKQEII